MGSPIMVDEMMVMAERTLLAKNAERGWMAEQAAARHGQSAFTTNRRRHSTGVVLLQLGIWLRGVTGVTPAGVLLTCRLTSTE